MLKKGTSYGVVECWRRVITRFDGVLENSNSQWEVEYRRRAIMRR